MIHHNITNLILIIFITTLIACSKNSNNSDSSIIKCDSSVAVGQVQIRSITSSDNSVRIEWQCSSATQYNLYYSLNKNVSPTNGELIVINNPNSSVIRGSNINIGFYDHRVQNNKLYFYVMTAVDSSGVETIVSRTVTAYPNKTLITQKDNFVDKQLHKCVLESAIYNNKYYSGNKWNYLSDVLDLDCSNEITDFSGIEKLSNLYSIRFSDLANIEFKSPKFTMLSNLDYISFDRINLINIDPNVLQSQSFIRDLSFSSSNFINTNWLNVRFENIRNLSFSDTPLSETDIQKINNKNLPKLTKLELNNTGRTNFNWLNTANLLNLRQLRIMNEIGLTDFTGFNAINLPAMKIINVRNMPSLGNLNWLVDGDFNNISTLLLRNIGLKNLTGFSQLDFDNQFVQIHLADNQLTNLNEIFLSNINLVSLSARNNLIDNVDGISSFGDKLMDIDLSGNNLADLKAFQGSLFPELISLSLGGNLFSTTTGFDIKPALATSKKFPKLIYLSLSKSLSNANPKVGITDFTSVANANLNSLVSLDIYGNAMTDFTSFSGANLNNLKLLACSKSSITSFDGFDSMGLNNLDTLYLDYLIKLPLVDQSRLFSGLVNANLSKLKYFSLSTERGLPDLQWFKSVNFRDLKNLYIYTTQINNLNWMDPQQMSKLTELRIVNASNQPPVNSDYTALGNVLTQLPILNKLSLTSYNYEMIEDLTWLNQNSGIQSLKYLEMSTRSLISTDGLTVQNVPNLRYLDLSGNSITGTSQLANSGLTNLEDINLTYNSFQGPNSIQPLSVFTNVKRIRLQGRNGNSNISISCNDLDNLITGLGEAVLDVTISIPNVNCILP